MSLGKGLNGGMLGGSGGLTGGSGGIMGSSVGLRTDLGDTRSGIRGGNFNSKGSVIFGIFSSSVF